MHYVSSLKPQLNKKSKCGYMQISDPNTATDSTSMINFINKIKKNTKTMCSYDVSNLFMPTKQTDLNMKCFQKSNLLHLQSHSLSFSLSFISLN